MQLSSFCFPALMTLCGDRCCRRSCCGRSRPAAGSLILEPCSLRDFLKPACGWIVDFWLTRQAARSSSMVVIFHLKPVMRPTTHILFLFFFFPNKQQYTGVALNGNSLAAANFSLGLNFTLTGLEIYSDSCASTKPISSCS